MIIWSCFINMDKTNDGYCTLQNLFSYVEDHTYSVVAPIIERFFTLIEKEHEDRVTFEEFFPACVAFAFFTREELIAFFFNLLDTDKDLILSKSELMSFVSKYRRGKKNPKDLITLYPPNVIIAMQ